MAYGLGVWLYLRVLAEPNPHREGHREWLVKDIMERAAAISGRPHSASKVCATLTQCLERRGHAVTLPQVSTQKRVWCLTEEVRPRARERRTRRRSSRTPEPPPRAPTASPQGLRAAAEMRALPEMHAQPPAAAADPTDAGEPPGAARGGAEPLWPLAAAPAPPPPSLQSELCVGCWDAMQACACARCVALVARASAPPPDDGVL